MTAAHFVINSSTLVHSKKNFRQFGWVDGFVFGSLMIGGWEHTGIALKWMEGNQNRRYCSAATALRWWIVVFFGVFLLLSCNKLMSCKIFSWRAGLFFLKFIYSISLVILIWDNNDCLFGSVVWGSGGCCWEFCCWGPVKGADFCVGFNAPQLTFTLLQRLSSPLPAFT